MADAVPPVPRRSPLAHMADRLACVGRDTGGALEVAEVPMLAQISVRLDPKGAAADAVGLVLGLRLPVEPDTAVHAGNLTALWLGPDEWLVLGPPGSRHDLESRIREAGGDEFVSVVDVSAQRTTLLVAGPRARDLLAHGCSLDLHPRAFPAGRCAQTTLARAQVVLVAPDGPGAGFRVLVRSSFAGYLTDWLLDASTEWRA
ncbi:sarcosine oxidase subunit gamma [Streptomyces sp. NPDC058848]|uniref:sarcosine oxidase subunit gamma n=1 Tax=unclassified Streptomyces TaxID=2593676 RepID=UPI00369E02C0